MCCSTRCLRWQRWWGERLALIFASKVKGSDAMTGRLGATQKRSGEMVLVGYYLSRCTDFRGRIKPCPPAALRVPNWNSCYDLFFDRLGNGRTELQFRHSLRNTRDTFDPLFDNGRVGWLGVGKRGHVLSERDQEIHSKWKNQSDLSLAKYIVEKILHPV